MFIKDANSDTTTIFFRFSVFVKYIVYFAGRKSEVNKIYQNNLKNVITPNFLTLHKFISIFYITCLSADSLNDILFWHKVKSKLSYQIFSPKYVKCSIFMHNQLSLQVHRFPGDQYTVQVCNMSCLFQFKGQVWQTFVCCIFDMPLEGLHN